MEIFNEFSRNLLIARYEFMEYGYTEFTDTFTHFKENF